MKIVVDSIFQHLTDSIALFPQRIANGQGDVVYDSRNRVVRFTLDGHTMMVKRFKRVNIIQQIVYSFFRRTKAERAFLFAKEFQRRGIDTPQPVAYMEERRLGLFTTGYFVSLETPGTETSLLLREVQDYPKELADAVAAQIALMHSQGVLHGDPNLSNFLCSEEDGKYHFCMIDINRSRFTDGWPTDKQCLQNMVRITHRRDLYEYLIRSYARQRGWDETITVKKSLQALDNFERKFFHI